MRQSLGSECLVGLPISHQHVIDVSVVLTYPSTGNLCSHFFVFRGFLAYAAAVLAPGGFFLQLQFWRREEAKQLQLLTQGEPFF